MARLRYTLLAKADLNCILDHIAEHRPLTAKKVVQRLRDSCARIASLPELGKVRRDILGEYRSFPVDRWIIFYRVVADVVEVHRILDGARDIRLIFK